MREAAFQDILDRLAERLGHGVFVDSVDGTLIGYSRQDPHPDQARVSAILTRRVDPELRRWQNGHGIAAATAPVRLPANAELGIGSRLCTPIRFGGRCLGYLWVPGDSASEPVDQAAAELGAFLAEVAVERGELLRRLLASDPGAFDLLAALEPALARADVVVCAAVTDREPPRPDAISFVTATGAIALYRATPSVPAAFDRALGRRYPIGVSDAVPFEPDCVRQAATQATSAARASAVDPALPRVLPWAKAGPYRLLLATPGERDTVLDPLEHEQGLRETLETYLDLGADVQRTAVALHVHRTTVYYRLDRAAALLSADLRDGLVRSYLHLALKARRLRLTSVGATTRTGCRTGRA